MVLEFQKIFELANYKQELSITAMETVYRINDFREKYLSEID